MGAVREKPSREDTREEKKITDTDAKKSNWTMFVLAIGSREGNIPIPEFISTATEAIGMFLLLT